MKAINSMYRKSPRFDSVGALAVCHCLAATCRCMGSSCDSISIPAVSSNRSDHYQIYLNQDMENRSLS